MELLALPSFFLNTSYFSSVKHVTPVGGKDSERNLTD